MASISLSRRKLLTAGLTAAGGSAGLALAARLADRFGLIPPDGGGIYGPGETLTYACQRILTSHRSLAREFRLSEVSRVAPVCGNPPETDSYQRLLAGGFADWRLAIDGLVARPASFSLAELKRCPLATQITEHICEQGWSYVAEWTGVPLFYLMRRVGVLPRARFVVFFPFDKSWGSLDMQDAWHPQTLIAHGMNCKELSPEHGAPVRLRVPRQLGYKSVKYLSRITLTDTLKNIGNGSGAAITGGGYSWYAGI
jgi:DMSO/TMAO reductase YedYZ molybdopterin-dependent catalytic subunit